MPVAILDWLEGPVGPGFLIYPKYRVQESNPSYSIDPPFYQGDDGSKARKRRLETELVALTLLMESQ